MAETWPTPFSFACPRCRGALEGGQDRVHCPADGLVFQRREGIWRFILPERAEELGRFIEEYGLVRADEGWGSEDSTYYRALPYRDLGGKHSGIWRIRARSYDALREEVVAPLGRERARPLKILDLGAGNGWLSYRLAGEGHDVAAVDLMTGLRDGLGAHGHYNVIFTPIQAEFDRLPFEGGQMDLAVYNASLHYTARFEETLAEGLRVLAPGGRLVIMDSPIYHDGGSGRAMVRERSARFQRQYGFRGDALPAEGYLTFDRLAGLEERLNLRWRFVKPAYGLRWAIRPWLARLRGGREPATFLLVVGTQAPPES